MSAALEARGLTLGQARADLDRIRIHFGNFAEAGKRLGIPAGTLYSAFSGVYGPGEKLLALLYGETGNQLLPALLGGGEPEPAAPAPQEAVAVLAPVCGPDAFGGLTVAELLLRAQRRAVVLENELDEAQGEIASLTAMALRLGGAGEQ